MSLTDFKSAIRHGELEVVSEWTWTSGWQAIGIVLEVIYPQGTEDRGRIVFHWMKNTSNTFDSHPLSWVRSALANGDMKLVSRAESVNSENLWYTRIMEITFPFEGNMNQKERIDSLSIEQLRRELLEAEQAIDLFVSRLDQIAAYVNAVDYHDSIGPILAAIDSIKEKCEE